MKILRLYKQLGIIHKILLPTLLVVPIGLFLLYSFVTKSSIKNLIDSKVTSSIASINQYKKIRGYYTKNIVVKAKKSGALKPHYNHKDFPDRIPLPATFIHDLSAEFKKDKSGVSLNLYSQYPFPHRKGRILDEFQKEAINAFKTYPDKPYVRTYLNSGKEQIRVAIADKMVAKGCVSCHNSHPETPKTGWKIGDVRGVLEFNTPITNELVKAASMRNTLMGGIGLTFLLIIIFILFVINSFVIKPVKKVTQLISSKALETLAHSKSLQKNSQGLSRITEQQASAVQETVSSLDEIKAISNAGLEKVQQASQITDSNRHDADCGVKVVSDMVDSINGISKSNEGFFASVEDNNRKFEEVVNIINDISEKTKVINDIVFQTKLLSFNASVEAARAGEMGKGFTVVAEEVGQLASVSGKASSEISEMLESSITKVRQIISVTQGSVSKMVEEGKIKTKQGEEIAENCADILTRISSSTSEVNISMSSIAESTEEQTCGYENIVTAMHDVSSSIDKSAIIASEVNEYAGAMSKNAENLNELVTLLNGEIFGKKTA